MLPTRHWGKLFDFHSSLLFAVAALLAPHSPETWLDLEGWSISWRRCQSSQSPRALMAALSSRFKFTSPRMRPGSTYKIHTSSRVHLKTTFDMRFISARTWSGSSRPWYDIWILYDMKTLTETFIWGHKLLPKYMHLSKIFSFKVSLVKQLMGHEMRGNRKRRETCCTPWTTAQK